MTERAQLRDCLRRLRDQAVEEKRELPAYDIGLALAEAEMELARGQVSAGRSIHRSAGRLPHLRANAGEGEDDEDHERGGRCGSQCVIASICAFRSLSDNALGRHCYPCGNTGQAVSFCGSHRHVRAPA